MSIHLWLNMPLRAARMPSPGFSVFDSAASQPPVPDAGKMNSSPRVVLSTFLQPSMAGCRIVAKSGERWSIVGMSQALRIASGMLVGPGIKTGF